MIEINKIIQGDTLEKLKTFPDKCVDCVITSPPYYGLRDYGVEGQMGLEPTLEGYLDKMLAITAELKRVLKKEGTMFWNMGDSYGGSGNGSWNAPVEIRGKQYRKTCNIDQEYLGSPRKDKKLTPKCLTLQNFRLIIRMIDEQGWILRNTLIWYKPNAMPASVKDRFSVDYEPVFFLVKSQKYWFEPQYEPVQEVSIARLNRAVSNKNKWINGEDEQTTNNLSQPRPNRNTKIPAEIAEKMGSPRARYKRYEASNAPHEFEGGDHLVSPFNPSLGRNKRCVWRIPTQPQKEAHFATYPEKLIIPMIKAGCPEMICKKCGKARKKVLEDIGERTWKDTRENNRLKTGKTGLSFGRTGEIVMKGYTNCGCNVAWDRGIVIDPFMGSGTTAIVAKRLRRNWTGIEINPEYIAMAQKRLDSFPEPMF